MGLRLQSPSEQINSLEKPTTERSTMFFSKCPKCGDTYYEELETHKYCVGCNYEEVSHELREWHKLEYPNESRLFLKQELDELPLLTMRTIL